MLTILCFFFTASARLHNPQEKEKKKKGMIKAQPFFPPWEPYEAARDYVRAATHAQLGTRRVCRVPVCMYDSASLPYRHGQSGPMGTGSCWLTSREFPARRLCMGEIQVAPVCLLSLQIFAKGSEITHSTLLTDWEQLDHPAVKPSHGRRIVLELQKRGLQLQYICRSGGKGKLHLDCNQKPMFS